MRRLAIFAFSFAAAAAAYIWLLPVTAALITSGVLLAAAVVLLCKKSKPIKRVRIFALGAAIGLLWSWGYEQLKIVPVRNCCAQEQTITATVIQTPAETKYGCKTAAQLAQGKIMLYLNCKADALSIGDEVCVCADVIDVSQGSGEEDNLYFQSIGISLIGMQRGALEIRKAKSLPASCILPYCAEVTRSRIMKIFPQDVSGFVKAILTGDRSGLSYALCNELSITGISHVIAVSGMHISLILGIVMFLCRRRQRLAALIGIPIMVFFAAMLGFGASVTRAVIMNAVFLLAPICKRENDAPTSLGFALLLILICNPWAIANLSLQLSFAAMVGIFWAAPKIFQWTIEKIEAKCSMEKHPRRFRALRAMAVIFSTSLGANLLTVPLVAWNFGLVSVIAPLTNLLTMTLLGAIFTLSFCAAVLSVWLPLGKIAGWLIAWPIRLVLFLVEQIAQIPFAAVYTCSDYVTAWLIAAYLMIALFYIFKRGRKPALLAFGILFSLVLAVAFSSFSTNDLEFTAFDVGQGQCLFVRTDSLSVMFDCGGDDGDENGETVARKLLMSGQDRIDALILSHFDTDHICGAEQLMRRIDIGMLYFPDVSDENGNRDRLVQIAQEHGISVMPLSSDLRLESADGTICLFVPKDPEKKNASISALMSLHGCDILITGDSDLQGEQELLDRCELPKIEILVAGHHGARNATGETLLAKTMPDAVIISVGKNNYGHPTQEMLDRAYASGASVYRTDVQGDIVISR